MPYSEREDIKSRLQALPVEGLVSVLDEAIDGAIQYSDSIIDSKLRLRYQVPFSPVPKLITNISADLATWKTLKGTFSGGGEDDEPILASSYRDDAMNLLCQLADGSLTLDPVEAPPAEGGMARVIPSHSRLGQRPVMETFDLYHEPRRYL